MIKNILIAVDGSDHAAKAAELAADLAVKYGAKVTLLHVMTKIGAPRVPEGLEEFARLEHVRVTEQDILASVARKIVQAAEDRVRHHGVKDVEAVIQTGDPAEEILASASARGADLIVMGSRGLGAVQGLLLGSVSHKVSHLAKCTCVTVR